MGGYPVIRMPAKLHQLSKRKSAFGRLLLNATLVVGVLACFAAPVPGQQWRSGQDSPVHDSDRLIPLSGKVETLENDDVRVSFDSVSGALVEFLNKKTNWNIQTSPELGQSFRVFAPTAERSYNPVLGARNKLASMTKSSDGQSLTMVWRSLQSEYRGTLDITLTGKVALDGADVDFNMEVKNNSGSTISSVEWPIVGALQKPAAAQQMSRVTFIYGTGSQVPLYPLFRNEHGYYGTNFPTQEGQGRYNIVLAGKEGLYIGDHDTAFNDVVHFTFALQPGYDDSFDERVPEIAAISGHPVGIVTAAEHFPFVPSGQSMALAQIVLSPFEGDWHHGADVYRHWHATWFHRPVTPAWAEDLNSWQQIQINSSEDDLRTPYRELPQRAAEAAKAGINAIQLVGWNNGGQDRGNPSHDTDPRLGTHEELKEAISKIQATGVHLILFNKYTWVDTSTPAYKNGLEAHVAHDPNGEPYIYNGYMYQTPEQLANINTRHFAVACTPDPYWLDLSAKEFRKLIDLGASGMLYDEVQHHGPANFCFSHKNGQLLAQSLWAGDSLLGQRFHDIVKSTVGEKNFLISGEAAYDLETRYYSLTYHRISTGHIPLERYDDPTLPMMIAVTGFDDREMINEALRYRYIMSYEPFNFKGNLSDFPLTLNYGLKMDAFRRKYKEYLWDAEFRDDQDAAITVSGAPYRSFSSFRRPDGKHAVVVVNTLDQPMTASVVLMAPVTGATLSWTSPDDPELHPFGGTLQVPARSAVVVLEH